MSSDLHAASFGSAAEAYQRGRPPYPAEAVAWAVPPRARRVLDLGAGTGKLTRALLDAGFDVDAVEPSPQMRDQLAVSAGQASIFEGTGESVPLPDASVDAVVCAQAWHWVDPARAVPEMARVLRPGGTLSLIWNVRDHTEPWVAALDDVLHRHTRDEIDTAPRIGGPFGDPERAEFRWRHTLDRAELQDMVASRSYVILLSEPDRRALLDSILDLLDRHGLGERFELPYVTRCTRARLR
ncbi:class I SAM-dependent methyltransferase [Actinoplanes xinjiangensis]|uniref:Ubiquinone/menaquinone biosynthesis C-methylase UbiE n=1 Tax=Actinoplanes xinjiangensis TaxID=512350 RepID=A0A316FBE3_9ACTN|nr:class I SAM-dependent methyltransferase [Actinoplanes xinjiangensis]PWK45093.1 ubiquinone/menaquinone biosynthesis C-methylase UbiE [Actinoplanes xinjiangensis]GIF41570.1 putative methyltransferase [Actinoplanes xinjiangensis]